jgi:hypothetical protein
MRPRLDASSRRVRGTNPWDAAAHLALGLCLRREEVLGLRWSDVGNEVHVRRTLTYAAGQYQFGGLDTPGRGLRFEAEPTIVAAGEKVGFAFTIVGPDGYPVRSFDELHERRMPSRRVSGMGCPRMPRTARSSASSKARRSSSLGTRRSGFSDAANLDEGALWAGRLRAEGVDRRRRDEDRRAREEGGERSPAPEPRSPPRHPRPSRLPRPRRDRTRLQGFKPGRQRTVAAIAPTKANPRGMWNRRPRGSKVSGTG